MLWKTTATVQPWPKIVLGALLSAVAAREFRGRAGSSPACRFVLGLFVMIGALVFLGCPLRMVIRLGGGDLTAVAGLLGFIAGILVGIVFLKKGFSLGRAYSVRKGEGLMLPGVMVVLLVLLVAAPQLLKFSEEGPGSMHAFWLVSLIAGLAVGIMAQRSPRRMAPPMPTAVPIDDSASERWCQALATTAGESHSRPALTVKR